MSIKVISYHPQSYGSFQLGFAIVELKARSRIIVKVCQSKKGDVFCCAPSIKLGESWVPTPSFNDKEAEKRFYHTINKLLIPLMERLPEPDPKKEQSNHEDDDRELPF